MAVMAVPVAMHEIHVSFAPICPAPCWAPSEEGGHLPYSMARSFGGPVFLVLTCPAPLESPAMPPSPSASSPLPLLTGMPGSPAEASLVLALEVGASTLSATLFEVNGLHVIHVEVVEWEKVRPPPCSSGEWTLTVVSLAGSHQDGTCKEAKSASLSFVQKGGKLGEN